MAHWKANKTSSFAGIPSSSSNKSKNRNKKENSACNSTETDDDDLHSASLNTHLLFPKESPLSSKEPLFPTSRKKFLIMTCKRTLFGCRGLILFCFIVFIVISFVSSQTGSDRNNDSVTLPSLTSSLSDNVSTNGTTTTASNNDKHHRYETVLLPPPITNAGNVSEFTANFNVDCTYKSTDYAVIGNALRKGLEFYEGNVQNLTVLDAALGAKIVAEQLKKIQQSHGGLPLVFKSFLHDLETKASTLTEQITHIVKQTTNNTNALKLTLPWIETEGLWNLPANKWHPVGTLASYNPPESGSFEELWNIAAKKEVLDENESDACINQVFHCDTANVTEKCKNVFLSIEGSMYSLTHQVIYMLLVHKMKCSEKSTWNQVPALQQKGDPFLEKLCGKVWQEANSIEEANFPPRFRDLFIEQIGMCSLAGYSDFLRRDWLRRIISWQSISSSGCFGKRVRRVPPPPTIGMLLREYQRLQEQQVTTDHWKSEPEEHGRRYKRSDVLVGGGNDHEQCSVHFTSVGIAALSLHLHYLFDTCFDAYQR